MGKAVGKVVPRWPMSWCLSTMERTMPAMPKARQKMTESEWDRSFLKAERTQGVELCNPEGQSFAKWEKWKG